MYPSRGRNDRLKFHDKYILKSDLEHTASSVTKHLFDSRLKNPRPAPSYNGAVEKKPGLHAHTISERGNGPARTKTGVEREMYG
jgi:hypothetical protein